MQRWVLRYAVTLAAVGALCALFLGSSQSVEGAVERASSESPATTTSAPGPTTTTPAPSLFEPLADRSLPAVVRTPGGLVLPVSGGRPGAWEVLTPCARAGVADGAPLSSSHLVLDPGHGGEEPGAVGPSGLTEAELNLDVARRAADLLAEQGATVVLTRTTHVRMTLETRAAIALALDPLAFISIHHNAAPVGRSDRPGSELYHQLADPQSKRLAGLLWEEFQQHLAPFGTDWAVGDQPGARARQSVRTGTDYYGVLRRTQGVPAVLTEAAYLSNPAEDALLHTAEFRQAEAQAIADAFVRFAATDDPGSGFAPTKVTDTPAGGGGGTGGCEDPPLS